MGVIKEIPPRRTPFGISLSGIALVSPTQVRLSLILLVHTLRMRVNINELKFHRVYRSKLIDGSAAILRKSSTVSFGDRAAVAVGPESNGPSLGIGIKIPKYLIISVCGFAS